jgi:hypothetical protein
VVERSEFVIGATHQANDQQQVQPKKQRGILEVEQGGDLHVQSAGTGPCLQ